ncbi:SprT family protein [Caryophanon tenue]|uniref:Protein SprT-like n=1 Tax=Caryophanon tenue TaxID=33978 RepID=A0A1C0YBF8_9BACL|nr:SprT family protein [Caryophanon tenue]OCS84480.1 SprT family protein [Caryophanon tenue]
MDNEALQLYVEQLSEQAFGKPFLHRAIFNPRLRTTGGRYMLATHHIEINKKSFEQFGEAELRGIVLHELCHYHLHIEGKGYQHRDEDFRQLLKKVGAPRFCSTLGTTKQPNRKQHFYRCVSCSKRYIRIKKIDVNRYFCGNCHGVLMYEGASRR